MSNDKHVFTDAEERDRAHERHGSPVECDRRKQMFVHSLGVKGDNVGPHEKSNGGGMEVDNLNCASCVVEPGVDTLQIVAIPGNVGAMARKADAILWWS